MSDLSDFKFYHYDPSPAAALIFTALFGLATAMHIFQMIRTRAFFITAFICGGILSLVGYVARYISSTQTPDWTLGPYIAQTLGLLLAPALFAASIYTVLGRIIVAVKAEHHSPIRLKWLTTLFVTGDVLSFLVQSTGGGLMAQADGDPDMVKIGENSIVGGLFLQLIFFALFVFTAILVHTRTNRSPTPYSELTGVPWRKHMYCLYFMSVLIFVRSVFRVAEYLQGYTGYLLSREAFLYALDSTLMLLVMLAFNIIHPSEVNALNRGGVVSRNAGFKYEYFDSVHSDQVKPYQPAQGAEMAPLSGRGRYGALERAV